MSKPVELKRSKSLCSLYSRQLSDISIEVNIVNESDADVSMEGRSKLQDSGIGEKATSVDTGVLTVLERKIDQLSDLFLEQCRLLMTIRGEINDSKLAIEQGGHYHHKLLEDMITKTVTLIQSKTRDVQSLPEKSDGHNSAAKSLLNAIEVKQAFSLDREIRDALTQFLQSDELKEHVVAATAGSVKNVIRDCLSKDVSDVYLPTIERSHRRLATHISRLLEEAFMQYENSTVFMNHAHRTARILRRALDEHQRLLETCNVTQSHVDLQHIVETLLKSELKDWRQKVVELLATQASNSIPERELTPSPPVECVPSSPMQPVDPNVCLLDQMMKSAEINKLIKDGEINASFERALSSSNLSLVMAACRAVQPKDLFTTPCKLEQPVLLSLVQQLATDLVHETHLKCRYLEDAIVHLSTTNFGLAVPHLPMVARDVRKHLLNFLQAYPGHIASRRISLIVMAVKSLIK